MQKFIIALSLLMVVIVTSRADAAAQRDSETLITFEEFSMMPAAAQDRYVTGLRALFTDWANHQTQEKLKYQSVDATSKSKAFAALSLFFGEAEAEVDQRPCAYAGYISEMDVNGKHCMSRAKCSIPTKKGWVQCNPLVYGEGVCAPTGNGGTAYCAKNAKSNEDIRKYILAHRQEFVNLRDQLKDVCPTVKNTTVCQAIQFRVGQMFDQVKGQLPRGTTPVERAETPVRTVGGVQVPPTGRPTGPQREGTNVPNPVAPRVVATPSSNGAAPRPASVSDVLASGSPRPAAAAPSRQSDGADIVVTGTRPSADCEPYGRPGECVASALMQPMTGPQDSSWAGKTLMGLDEAKGLMCATTPVNPAFLDSVRKFIRQQQSRVAAMTRREQKYYSCHYKQMADNFEACVKMSNENRAAGKIFDGGPIGATLVQRGNIIDMKLTGTSDPKSTGTVEPYLGLMIGLWKVDLCKVTMTTASGGGSAQPNTPVPQPAQGGSGTK